MIYEVNETHDPNITSWLESANDPKTDFPLQNLPVCRFIHRNTLKIGIAIGDFVLDFEPYYNVFVGYEKKSIELAASHKVRQQIIKDFSVDAPSSKKNLIADNFLIPIRSCEFVLPFEIGDYTDFYCSIFHATNVGRMLRPDNTHFPNYKWLPVGYHGRASSVVISGTKIKRPKGQNRSDATMPPVFVPCRNLYYEVEV